MSNKKVSMSPILKQILWGGSSISLDVGTLNQRKDDQSMRFFDSAALNGVIIFKYPNFNDTSSDDAMPWETDVVGGEASRPVETGLFSPTTRQRPEAGGSAIYMRSKHYAQLLEDSFGVSETVSPRDMALLKVIDSTPSLDPFLLRAAVEEQKLTFNHELWNISDQENEMLRRIIAGKILPIIEVALQGSGDDSGGRVNDFLKAIWNPDLPDAQKFVASFGFDSSEAKLVFNAWKGITFYEAQTMRCGPKAAELLKWLRSPKSIPLDITSNRMFEQQLSMFIARTGDDLEQVLKDVRAVLVDYQACLQAFKDNKPEPFREFLRTCQAKYWLMGYCISAINSVTLTFHQYRQRSSEGRLFFAPMNEMLRQMSVALDRRRERPVAL